MKEKRLEILFRNYLSGTLAAAEEQELSSLLLDPALKGKKEELLDKAYDEAPEILMDAGQAERVYALVRPATPVRKIHWRRWAAAAILFIAFSIIGRFAGNNHEKPTQTFAAADIPAPKNTKAFISLSNGSRVPLDSVNSGILAQQSGGTVTKTADGKIVYQQSTGNNQPSTAFNTLTNPRGSPVIDMQLSDGSRVWLNAGSSLTYPVAFNGKERNVAITGEAYFEVAHNPAMPFTVSKGDMRVQVLGTHFNINAYDDEPNTRVTLLEGSIKVSSNNAQRTIKPGEQAMATNGQLSTVNAVDLDQVMAWKDGSFMFKGADMHAIMRQLERWYDVKVDFKTEIPSTFVAKVSRTENVSQVLKLLELTGLVHFTITGNTVTVMK